MLDHALISKELRTASAETAAWLSLVAYARHVHTDYDELLQTGYDRVSARHFVANHIEEVLRRWGVKRKLEDASGLSVKAACGGEV